MMFSVSRESASRSPVNMPKLDTHVQNLRAAFLSAEPWPHVVLDDFLDPEIAKGALSAFPAVGAAKTWLARFLGARSYRSSPNVENEFTSLVFEQLHSSGFTRFLEQITGIEGLEPDREQIGAGFHQGLPGSYLRVHSDHNTHPFDPSRYRRVSVLVYLNDHWVSSWNGDLELWDRDATSCRKKVAPIFNRCIIMQVDDTAFHGYGPLRLPKGQTRKALAAYYYTKVPGAGQAVEPHFSALPELRSENFLTATTEHLRRSALYRIEKILRIPKY